MKPTIREMTFTFVLLTVAPAVLAQSESNDPSATEQPTVAEVLAGHSFHGEAFNEGPRQQAYLMEGLGHVVFPVSTEVTRAQDFVTQGVAQLHGFWYFEAERSFRQAAALDPNCAMAYWGMAMSNRNNEERAKGFIAEAVDRKEQGTDREQRYINALNDFLAADPKKQKKERSRKYSKALEQLIYKYPDDVEAKAFLVLQLWNNRSAEIPITSYLAVEALIKQILVAEPMHPVHHYQIHLWDYEKPERALEAATLCGQTLPAIAHMWHMPGHTFSRVKRYNDAAWQQEASARVDHAHMMRDGIMPDQIHNFAHNNEWLIRNLNHVGRVWDAFDLAKNMIELPRHPNYNTLAKRGSANYGRTRLLETLARYELWDKMIALSETPYLEATNDEDDQVKRQRFLGQAYFRGGEVGEGEAILADLRSQLEEKQRQKTAAEKLRDAAKESQEEKQDSQAAAVADGPDPTKSKAAAAEKDAAADPEDEQDDASAKLAAAARKLEKAVQELEGHLAVSQGKFEDGWQKLKKAGADPMYRAKIQLLAGHAGDALKAAEKFVRTRKNEVQPLAQWATLLWFAEQRQKAKEVFAELREISGPIDVDTPVMERLTPIARAIGLEGDWRLARAPGDDVGIRPDLDSLGEFRWQPSPAPSWSLKDTEGSVYSLEEFSGQPLLLIFYLGSGCLHCAEQLNEFAPVTDRFREAGIQMLGISTDDEVGLQVSADNYDGNLPFALLSDADHTVFRKYRAYDDFEKQPLHGTFLIDAQGRVRWQDISYEPFMDAEFVLNEARRLLGSAPAASAKVRR